MKDSDGDGFEEFVKAAINELDPQPAVPRDEMWAHIEAARRFRRASQPRGLRWTAWGLGLAATLAVGIGLGRLTLREPSVAAPTAAPVASSQAGLDNGALGSYRVAALQHMGRAELLLTSVSAGAVDTQVVEWAADMLTTTRLLLDSPAASDTRFNRLLQDLELLLAQLASTSTTNRTELDLIQHGIDQTDVLPRLRATLPRGMAAGT